MLSGLLLLSACTAPKSARLAKPAYDYGPFAAGVATVDGSRHATVAGPFFETAVASNETTLTAYRPFTATISATNDQRRARDILWPVAQKRQFKDQSVSRFLMFMHYNHGGTNQTVRKRTWLLPFWFHGTDAQGQKYWALFPVYGSIHEFIGLDRIDFVLFPLRSTSTLNDLKASNWFWPIYSHTTSSDGHIERQRLFPLYAYSHYRDRFTKRSVLWPIWTSVRYEYPKEKGGGWILWPVCGRMKTDHESTVWVVPPLFRFTSGREQSRVYCPWPFIQWERGTMDKTYVWPLWGHRRIGNLDATFYAWPIVWNDHVDRGWIHEHLFMIAPVYRHETVTQKSTNGLPPLVIEKQRKVWPLANYQYDQGQGRFRVPDLWPFADNAHVDLNWAPIWTLYDCQWNRDNIDSSLLWGMYRHQARGASANYFSVFPLWSWRRDDEERRYRGWSVLRGLVAREADETGSAWRLLYFMRFGELKGQEP